MEFLDAYHDEILAQLLGGEWEILLPTSLFSDVIEWFEQQREKKEVAVRVVVSEPESNDLSKPGGPYALYIMCEPKISKGRVRVLDFKLAENNLPLALPPFLYEIPLYCMPRDLYSKILNKKKRS